MPGKRLGLRLGLVSLALGVAAAASADVGRLTVEIQKPALDQILTGAETSTAPSTRTKGARWRTTSPGRGERIRTEGSTWVGSAQASTTPGWNTSTPIRHAVPGCPSGSTQRIRISFSR